MIATLFEWVVIRIVVYLRSCEVVLEGIIIKQWYLRLSLCIEVNRWNLTELTYTLTNSCRENLPDGLLVLKLNLSLGRMYVNIYLAWLYLYI